MINSGVETYSLAGRLVNEQYLLRKYAPVVVTPLRVQSSRTERRCDTRLAKCVPRVSCTRNSVKTNLGAEMCILRHFLIELCLQEEDIRRHEETSRNQRRKGAGGNLGQTWRSVACPLKPCFQRVTAPFGLSSDQLSGSSTAHWPFARLTGLLHSTMTSA